MSKRNGIICAVVIALALLLTLWLLPGYEDAKAQKAVEALGGKVIRSVDEPGRPIMIVDFSDMNVTDAALTELVGLKSLQNLHLGGTKVTDVGLKELAGLKRLRVLALGNTNVTDAG